MCFAVPSRRGGRTLSLVLACVFAFPALLSAQARNQRRPADIAAQAAKALVRVTAFDSSGREGSQGTGFFIRSNGTLVTNYHVVEGANRLEVETESGERFDRIFVVATDPRRDLAVLRIPSTGTPALTLKDDQPLMVGETVYVMGNPQGLDRTFSNGVLSARRLLDGVSLIQISAPISPGSSGGPVMNDEGAVIGIATLSLSDAQNLNFAVPSRYVDALLQLSPAAQPFSPSLVAARPGQQPKTSETPATEDKKEPEGRSASRAPAPAPKAVTLRVVNDRKGLYKVTSLPSSEGRRLVGRVAIFDRPGGEHAFGWWQAVDGEMGAKLEEVSAPLSVGFNGEFSLPLNERLIGGFVETGEVLLAPVGLELTAETVFPRASLSRQRLLAREIGGVYSVEGTGGVTDLKPDKYWRGQVAVVPTSGAVGQSGSWILLAVSLTEALGEIHEFTDSAPLAADGSFSCSSGEVNGERVSCAGTISGDGMRLYIHRGRKLKFDLEANVSGRRR